MSKLLFAVVAGLLALASLAGGRSDPHRRTRTHTATPTASATFTVPAPTDAPVLFVVSEPSATPTATLSVPCAFGGIDPATGNTYCLPTHTPAPPTETYWPTAYP